MPEVATDVSFGLEVSLADGILRVLVGIPTFEIPRERPLLFFSVVSRLAQLTVGERIGSPVSHLDPERSILD